MEIWKDILGYEGLYQVSNLGNIKSIERLRIDTKGRKRIFPQKIIKPLLSDRGYCQVNLYKNSKLQTRRINRLVALSFIPNLQNKEQVNHINGIKTDNSVPNLEWTTSKENVIHSFKTGLKRGRTGTKCNFSKLSESDVLKIRNSDLNYSQLSELFSTTISNISNIKNNITWKI